MKRLICGFVVAALFVLPVVCAAGDWTGNINGFLGAKILDEDDWAPIDEQDEFGIRVDFKKTAWPVSVAVAYKMSVSYLSDDDNRFWLLDERRRLLCPRPIL